MAYYTYYKYTRTQVRWSAWGACNLEMLVLDVPGYINALCQAFRPYLLRIHQGQ
jgi:hypothetical protein